ncbi:MAG: phosphoribosylamine--glycine ligase [Candidatus Acidiferrales bacterium]
MKILIIGGGGREHALAWKLRQSPLTKEIWCAPGNGGISTIAECMPLDIGNVRAVAELAAQLGADLTIVGPELPLVDGVVDEFSGQGLTILGPARLAARLEGSKIFAKEFMKRHDIPTAPVIGVFDSVRDATSALKPDRPLVVKADGLCAGKGVLVTASAGEAATFIDRLIVRKEFGESSRRVLIEEALIGHELSYIVLTDGTRFISMVPTRDHKRAFDHDEGPNTGGMGTYSCEDILPPELENDIMRTIVEPTLAGLRKEKMAYRGFIFFGLMLTGDGPKVLEYNCRLGDPEAQSIMMRADFDLAAACMKAATGALSTSEVKWKSGASVCVVIAAEGYPGKPVLGAEIKGLREAGEVPGSVVFHAGTRQEDGNYRTSGGRILGVAAAGPSLREASETAYYTASKIRITGAHYRKDIGMKDETAAYPSELSQG